MTNDGLLFNSHYKEENMTSVKTKFTEDCEIKILYKDEFIIFKIGPKSISLSDITGEIYPCVLMVNNGDEVSLS